MDAKKLEIERLEQLILNELDAMSTPMELKATDDNQKLARAGVLFNIYKVLVNYDEIEPVLSKFFGEKAKKMKFWEEER